MSIYTGNNILRNRYILTVYIRTDHSQYYFVLAWREIQDDTISIHKISSRAEENIYKLTKIYMYIFLIKQKKKKIQIQTHKEMVFLFFI